MAVRIQAVKKSNGVVSTFANVAESKEPAKAVKVKVTKRTDGSVTFLQKLQGYYKTVVVVVGSLLTLATQVQTLTPFLPDQERHWIATGVLVLTAASTFLVRNQTWVEDL